MEELIVLITARKQHRGKVEMSTQQLVQEMTSSLRISQGQLDSVNQQLAHIRRQEQLAQITAKELSSYPTNEVWRSCGKTFILQGKDKYMKDLSHDESILKDQKKNLEIKQDYLQTSVEKTVQNLKEVLQKK